jgi:hypothetical protein
MGSPKIPARSRKNLRKDLTFGEKSSMICKLISVNGNRRKSGEVAELAEGARLEIV